MVSCSELLISLIKVQHRQSFIAVANLIALTVSQKRNNSTILEGSVKIEILSVYAIMNNDRNLQY